MKENVLDLLIYLFENYMSADDEPRPDRSTLKVELDKAGFAEPDIERAHASQPPSATPLRQRSHDRQLQSPG